jgi:hypothetical protein
VCPQPTGRRSQRAEEGGRAVRESLREHRFREPESQMWLGQVFALILGMDGPEPIGTLVVSARRGTVTPPVQQAALDGLGDGLTPLPRTALFGKCPRRLLPAQSLQRPQLACRAPSR